MQELESLEAARQSAQMALDGKLVERQTLYADLDAQETTLRAARESLTTRTSQAQSAEFEMRTQEQSRTTLETTLGMGRNALGGTSKRCSASQ